MSYPLPSRSEEDHWPMSHGLVEDVAEALARHGYPPIEVSPAGAADYMRLRRHLWHFITDRECDVLDEPLCEIEIVGALDGAFGFECVIHDTHELGFATEEAAVEAATAHEVGEQ